MTLLFLCAILKKGVLNYSMADNNELKILVTGQLILNPKEINQKILNMQKKIETLGINIKVNDGDLDKVQYKIQKFTKESKLSGEGLKEFQQRIDAINKTAKEQAKVTIQTYANTNNIKKAVIEYTDATGKAVKETMSWTQHLDKANNIKKKIFKTTGYTFTDDIKKYNEEVQKAQKIGLNNLSNKYKQQQIDAKTLIGTYKELKKEQLESSDVAKILSKQYGNLEVREKSLDNITGKYSVTLRKSAKENLTLRGTIDKVNGALRVQSQRTEMARNAQLGMMEQFKIAAQRVKFSSPLYW